MQVTCLKAGLYTSIQDEGRMGVQDQGIPFSGALDKSSMHIANQLVGNPLNSPVLEMTMFGPILSFENSGQIAITGANMKATLNGVSIESYKTIDIEKGDRLEFHDTVFGCRTYLAIGGEWLVPQWLGSYSALPSLIESKVLPSKIKDGYTFRINTGERIAPSRIPVNQQPIYSECYIIRVVTGPEFSQFDIDVIQSFFEQIFIVDADSNRMGYRLKGVLSNYKSSGEEISSGITIGTVQLNNAGSPIILMADAQTTGGYPRIANVVTEDLEIVAQMKPKDELKFMLISLEGL
ncbi:biotin-dependent carboxyltransferase family protein [Fabibacter sp. E12]|nr:biotin-dependent carboxyltransferase family protein [Roseivirga sp. E12]